MLMPVLREFPHPEATLRRAACAQRSVAEAAIANQLLARRCGTEFGEPSETSKSVRRRLATHSRKRWREVRTNEAGSVRARLYQRMGEPPSRSLNELCCIRLSGIVA
jgi:hypothetical protein